MSSPTPITFRDEITCPTCNKIMRVYGVRRADGKIEERTIHEHSIPRYYSFGAKQ